MLHASCRASTSSAVVMKRRSVSFWPFGKGGLVERVQAAADTAAVNPRPLLPRMERVAQELAKQRSDSPLWERRVDEVLQKPQGRVWTEVCPIICHQWEEGLTSSTWDMQHKTSTGLIPTSPRKLNLVARLIARKPVDSAILQLQMSDKRHAKTRVKSMLALARDHAVAKGLDREKLIVQEAWVSKGVYLKRLDIKGRGRHGVIMKPEWAILSLSFLKCEQLY